MASTLPPRAVACMAITSDAYDLNARLVELQLSDGDSAQAYLTEEQETERRPRASRAIVLLPGDADGVHSLRTRRLADRLAVFCCALVLVPDLARGDGSALDGATTWVTSLPPRRVATDVREWSVYLRADHRAGPVAVAGTGHGAPLMLRTLSGSSPPLAACAGLAICAPRVAPDEFEALQAPVLCLFDSGRPEDDALAVSARGYLEAAEGSTVASAPAPAPAKPPSPSPPPPPMVMQFAGLEGALERLAAPVDDATADGAAVADAEGDDVAKARAEGDGDGDEAAAALEGGGLGEDESGSVEDDGEDGLIMAEAWLNLHLDRQQAARAG